MDDLKKTKIVELSEAKYPDGSRMYSRTKIALMAGCTVSDVRKALGGRRGEYEAMKANPARWEAYKERQRAIMRKRRKAEEPERTKERVRRALAALRDVKPEHLSQGEINGLAKAMSKAAHGKEPMGLPDEWFAGAKYLAARCKPRKAAKGGKP